MKIGILTLPIENNYGGILQTFALQKVLHDMGHDAITIDRHNQGKYSSFINQIAGFLKRNYEHYIYHKQISTKWNPFLSESEEKQINANIRPFIDKNIKLTHRIYSSELAQIDNEYQFDAYVVGSDQIWLPYYFPESFLSFVNRPNVRRVCYAASCGRFSWMNDEKNYGLVKKYASQFQGISVREDYLVPMSKKILEAPVEHVLDPTMLIDVSKYMEAVECIKDTGARTLFSYILDSDDIKSRIKLLVAEKMGLKTVSGKNENQYIKGSPQPVIDNCVCYSMDNWLNGIYHADFVITDSFHGTVFSILFNKPFMTIGNERRGIKRFQSLLKMFDLENRIVQSEEEAMRILKTPIDYDSINIVLNKWREKSISFLSSSLN